MSQSYDDPNIEVAREDEVLQDGQNLEQYHCKKNPGHLGFISFKDLTLEYIPRGDRSQEMLNNIKRWGDCVVRLVVKKKKNGKLVKEVASGWVVKDKTIYQIKTNNHVVKTNYEVRNCTVEFFYDSQDKTNVFKSKGVKLQYTNSFIDASTFSFKPVPNFLNELDIPKPDPYMPYIVIQYKKHPTVTDQQLTIVTDRICPHCISSQSLYFTSVNLNSPDIVNIFINLVDRCSVSYFKSSYFKFEPIPKNIQELTSIEIHIDEDDGNSRVIPGDVVKFGDEFVVKIKESIFHDEVKKCRLVWNDEVIGRGTRLYFQQVKSREYFGDLSGIDFKQLDESFPSTWLFDFHPKPRIEMAKNSELADTHAIMCCIGHPHGGNKRVSFGPNLFETSLKRLHGHGRPTEDCICQVPSINYTCATCPGSSGSPVFLTCTPYDMGSAVTHAGGERMVALLPNTVLNEMSGITNFVGKRVELLLPGLELIYTNFNTGWG